MQLNGTVLNGYGAVVGSGLVLDDAGALVEVLPVAAGTVADSAWITPGLIDVHCHGGGGASFPDDARPAQIAQAVAAHRQLGTTAVVASTVSMADPMPVITELAAACDRGELAGIHLEGPFISAARTGAQDPKAVSAVDLEKLRSWLVAGRGWIKTVTLAPELTEALAAARLLLDMGAIPSWGHTDATALQMRTALAETASYARQIGWSGVCQTATHLFNAMPPLSHRAPGPVRELLHAARRGEVVVELIADTVHLHPDVVADVAQLVGDGAYVLVSDAMAGAGMPDGNYVLGGLPVEIIGGMAHLEKTGALAGGTARLAEEIARMVRGGSLTLAQAVRACVATPAAVLHATAALPGVTLDFQVGEPVNAVVFTAQLEVAQVWRAGQRV
ncbi:MAG: amidohydrolase family protein [Trueperella sp.]|nr:amidohydrolase family protein [Trueperella sp.]